MRFVKFHGYGNDYLVFEAGELTPAGFPGDFTRVTEADRFGEFVRRVCDRHYGAGSDGIAVLEALGAAKADESERAGETEKADETTNADKATKADGAGERADFRLRIFNPDGSEAAMSGNGSRCAAAYLHHRGIWAREELRLSTRAGVKLYRLKEKLGAGRYRFEAETGRPRFDSDSIPFRTGGPGPLAEVRGHPLPLPSGESVEITALQMCNPNCVVFVDDFERTDWRRLGSLIEPHRQFPEKTNVEFVRVADRGGVEARVWERGVGETLSSGTGACAAAVASILNNFTDRRVRVSMPGGLLEVHWRDDGEVLLTGEAEAVYAGELFAS